MFSHFQSIPCSIPRSPPALSDNDIPELSKDKLGVIPLKLSNFGNVTSESINLMISLDQKIHISYLKIASSEMDIHKCMGLSLFVRTKFRHGRY